jgi:Rad3-related DNA helicase
MAYDPKDPADKKIVADLIAAALADAEDKHESDIAGLKANNARLKEQLKKATAGEANAEEITKLESELATSQAKLKTAEKDLIKITKERDETVKTLEAETGFTQKLLVDNGLTEALVKANVTKQFLPAVKALLASKVTLKVDGDNRVAMVGDKPLGEFVDSWAKGDDGKHYVAAPANGGGGSNGGTSKTGSGKSISQTGFDAMKPSERAAFFAEGGVISADVA